MKLWKWLKIHNVPRINTDGQTTKVMLNLYNQTKPGMCDKEAESTCLNKKFLSQFSFQIYVSSQTWNPLTEEGLGLHQEESFNPDLTYTYLYPLVYTHLFK